MRISAVWYPVSQWEAAKTFYQDVLGLPLSQANDASGWAAFATGGPPLFWCAGRTWRGARAAAW